MQQHSVTMGAALWIKAHDKADQLRARLADDRGATTVEYVLLVAGVAALAIGLVVAIRAVVSDTANNIPTNVDTSTTLRGN